MQFVQEFFKFINDESVVGLCGLKKKKDFVYINIPKDYKRTFIQNTDRNYLLL